MATEKNITMKQFNGTDYDTLYPKTIASQIPDVYSKTDTITAETLSRLGLGADKLPNDAFQQIKTLIDNVQTSTNSKARIQTGSYVGTGTYGKNNPCSLTFDFPPKIVFVFRTSDRYQSSHNDGYGRYVMNIFAFGGFKIKTGSGSTDINYSISGNKLSWYSDSDSEGQINYSNETYGYIGIG